MTACIVCPKRSDDDEGHPPEPGWLCCFRAYSRLSAALRALPELVDELLGLGYVVRDGREPKLVDDDGRPVPHFDQVANVLTAGPAKGGWRESRIRGTRPERVPIAVDATDLTGAARPASLTVVDRGLWPEDQVGHLAVATELEFWARDWADERRESCPLPTVPLLASWLLDRLDWAGARYAALDEFAAKVLSLRGALTAAAGRLPARPETREAPCPGCGQLTLIRDADMERVTCADPSSRECEQLMTDEGYAEYARGLIGPAS